jgi:hypothetical protein
MVMVIMTMIMIMTSIQSNEDDGKIKTAAFSGLNKDKTDCRIRFVCNSDLSYL